MSGRRKKITTTNQSSLRIKDSNSNEVTKLQKRQQLLKIEDSKLGATSFDVERVGRSNCENLVGSIEIPVGVVGPVRVTNLAVYYSNRDDQDDLVKKYLKQQQASITALTKQDIYLPLATTEGALVASVARGCKVINLANSLKVSVRKVGISRSLVFETTDNLRAHQFITSFRKNLTSFIKLSESTSKHLKFLALEIYTRGKLVYLRFSFDSDEAMGMNMISYALATAWQEEKKKYRGVSLLSLSANVCSDKKVASINALFGRGYTVELDLVIPASLVETVLKTTTKKLVKTHLVKNVIGSNLAGSPAQNMQVANSLVAFYLATGQDPAHCVASSESAVNFEELSDGSCYVSLTLPNITVGSVGGGTWLAKQKEARRLIFAKSNSTVTALVLAVASGVASLAGEISGLASLSSNSLAQAHQRLTRGKR